MADRILHVQTNSGLASRMRAVVGGLAYCHATGRRLIVDWPRREPSETSGLFPAKFHDLWANSDIEETDCHQRFQKDAAALHTDADVIKLRTCHIETFMEWIPDSSPQPFIDMLQPSNAVLDAIEAAPPYRGGQYIGINIRYALKQPQAAEPEWFIERMHKFPDSMFFCSLDSSYVESLLRTEFGDRIVCQRKDYNYDREGIIKTCADLYLLSACDYVIGSNFSSYSQMVAFMRGAQYVGSHERPELGLVGGHYEDMWNQPE